MPDRGEGVLCVFYRNTQELLPDFTVTKDFFDKNLSLDKRDDSHSSSALWTFEWVYFENTLDERRPRHATFATV
jgi:hypothetical protein